MAYTLKHFDSDAYNHIPIDQNLRVETVISKRQREEWDQIRLMILWDRTRMMLLN